MLAGQKGKQPADRIFEVSFVKFPEKNSSFEQTRGFVFLVLQDLQDGLVTVINSDMKTEQSGSS